LSGYIKNFLATPIFHGLRERATLLGGACWGWCEFFIAEKVFDDFCPVIPVNPDKLAFL
jgi:hypothetical protein